MRSTMRIAMVLVCAFVPATLAADPQPKAPESQAAPADAARAAEKRLYDAELAQAYEDQAQQQRDRTEAELQHLREAIRRATGRTDVSAEGLRKLVQTLEEQREALELDEAGAQARKAALEDAIKTAAQHAAKSVDGDAAVRELRAVVDMREAQLSRMIKLNETGAVTQGDRDAAQAELAQAKANLALRQHQAALDQGGDDMTALNRDLVNLSIAQAERLARLEFIKRRLDKLREAMPMLDDLDGLQGRLQRDQAAVYVAAEKAKLAQWDAAMRERIHAATTAPAAR